MIQPGSKLAHYEIVSALGKGGMGEVWRARDTKLGREVAIKTLPSEFAEDPDRLARFEREARMLAALNHPNIAAIYGLEEHESSRFLVLELVEGDTLADRLRRGAIPVEESLKLALEIAAALEAAHEKGVVHRDLKPANIKVTDDGKVKVLDFGLAKVFSAEDPDVNLSNSPTLSMQATRAGIILGTAAYMSPEQARGQPVDRRADIWAFGAVLYEMLTGRTAFDGATATDILGAVLRLDPAWNELPSETPEALLRLLHRSLEKDPRRRQRDAGDVMLELETALGEAAAGPPTASPASRFSTAPWVVAAALAVVAVGLVVWQPGTSTTVHGVRRYTIDLPWQTMPNWGDFRARISPRGTHLAFPGSDENRTTIMLRPLDSLEITTLVSPSADPWNLAFSPDGERIAFFRGRQLLVASIRGGQPEPIAELSDERFSNEISWASDGSILLAGIVNGLMRVSDRGGEAEIVATPPDNALFMYPFVLPNGTHALVSLVQSNRRQLAVVDLTTGEVRDLQIQGEEPIYSAGTGHLLFRQGDEILAARFDSQSLELQGQAVIVERGVAYGPDLSADGTLVYVAERTAGTAGLVWVDREGNPSPIPGERRDYTHIDLSPDGNQVLLNMEDGQVYVSDLAFGGRNLLSDSATAAGFPLWHSDGERATFTQGRSIVLVSAEGEGQDEQVLDFNWVPTSWSPDGNVLVYSDDRDVWIKPLDADPEPFLNDPSANERSGRFSPDGSAMAYVSDESGEFQIYVTSFPDKARTIPISINGGLSPIWSTDGGELYFRQGGKVLASTISWTPELSASPPDELFEGPWTLDLSGHQRYDVAPDGRFLMVENSEDFRVVVVEGFFEELSRLVP